MKELHLEYHQDPAHGWVEVPLKTFMELGGSLASLSSYSYCGPKGFDVILYLEEDNDATVLLRAAKERNVGVSLLPIFHDYPCFVRSLPHIPLAKMKAALEEKGLPWV